MEFKHVTDREFEIATEKAGAGVFMTLIILAEVAVCAFIVLGKLGGNQAFLLVMVGVVSLGLVLMRSVLRKQKRNERYESYLSQLTPDQLEELLQSDLDRESKAIAKGVYREKA